MATRSGTPTPRLTANRPLIERLLGAYWALIGDYHNDCAARITAPRRGPTVGLAVRGARPPGLWAAVCPAPSRPRARPTRAYAVVRRTRRRGGVVRGTAVRAGWGRLPRGVAGACGVR